LRIENAVTLSRGISSLANRALLLYDNQVSEKRRIYMFAPERKRRIKEIILEEKQDEVSRLCKILNVSEATVRRDLERLEDEKFLTRTYGGAFINEDRILTIPAPGARQPSGKEEALFGEIGEIAALLVEPGSSVIIGPGKAGAAIARRLKEKGGLLIITTDMNVADEVLKDPRGDSKVMFIGGDIDPVTRQAFGPISSMVLSNLHVDISFIEPDGVIADKGYYVDNYDKATVINNIRSVSKTVIAVCPYMRFGQPSLFFLGPMGMFSSLITNAAVADDFKTYYFDHGVKLYTSIDLYEKPIDLYEDMRDTG
jgi:DeoR/GlpR family transcriptional regulator of sugar metabolism